MYAFKRRNISSEWLYEQYENASYAGGWFPAEILAFVLVYITFLPFSPIPKFICLEKKTFCAVSWGKAFFDQLGQKKLLYFWKKKKKRKKRESILQVLDYPFNASINIKQILQIQCLSFGKYINWVYVRNKIQELTFNIS